MKAFLLILLILSVLVDVAQSLFVPVCDSRGPIFGGRRGRRGRRSCGEEVVEEVKRANYEFEDLLIGVEEAIKNRRNASAKCLDAIIYNDWTFSYDLMYLKSFSIWD